MAVLLERANIESISSTVVPYSTLGSDGLTYALWIRSVDVAVGSHPLVLRNSSTGDTHDARISSGTTAQAFSSAGGTSASSQSTIAVNEWHHICAVFAGDSSRTVYLDGVAGTEETTTRAAAGLNGIWIGARSLADASGAFDGYVAHAAVWKRALSAAEAASLAGHVRPDANATIAANLWAYLPLISDSDDLVGNATWTENGTLSYDASDPLEISRRIAHMEWCQAFEPGLPWKPVTFEEGDQRQLLWGYPFTPGTIDVSAAVAAAPSGVRRSYPRTIIIGKRRYRVDSPEHEFRLLREYIRAQKREAERTEPQARPQLRRQIKLTQTRLHKLAQAEPDAHKLLLRQMDEELVLLLASAPYGGLRQMPPAELQRLDEELVLLVATWH